ncbi:MAG TPA: queuosine precursor transporter [Anaerolineales bacterium]|nr:queuosine precursor transporter [Anaerolineales bacterium]HRF46540.1 queuosine precursor transporter [Anaerolineales bacterium]
MSSFRFLDRITGLFVAVLIISNIASVKIVTVGPFTFDGGTLLFPLAYIFGDVLTEVYGFRAGRRVIWTGFAALALLVVTLALVDRLPPESTAFTAVLGQAPRIALASLIAYWAGEFTNSIVLARMKVATGGRWLWTRTIGSTLVGQAVDTTVFVVVAFYGVLPDGDVTAILISNYVFKVAVETALTPLTYAVVTALKRAEGVDAFDRDTDFNPLVLQ